MPQLSLYTSTVFRGNVLPENRGVVYTEEIKTRLKLFLYSFKRVLSCELCCWNTDEDIRNSYASKSPNLMAYLVSPAKFRTSNLEMRFFL